MNRMSMKCRKCRQLLLLHPDTCMLTAHGESCSLSSVEYLPCATIQEDNIWFISESSMPDWISNLVSEGSWTKGKVNCPKCSARLGSFDFISGQQCQCGQYVLPPVHIVKCKVDCRNET